MAYTFPQAPVGSIWLTAVSYTFANQTLRNQFHWRLEGNANNRNVDVVAAALNTHHNQVNGLFAQMKKLRDLSCNHAVTSVQMIRPDRYVGLGFAGSGGGDIVGDLLDVTQLAAVLTRRAVVATRRGRSNLHLPLAADETVIDAGILSPAAMGFLTDVGNSILNTLNLGDGISVRPIIYHRGAVPEFNYVESFITQPQVRVVRRRTVGLGE
jgi:hypothetical protein